MTFAKSVGTFLCCAVLLLFISLHGCGKAPPEPLTPSEVVSADDAARDVIAASPETLAAAKVDGNLATVAKEIVAELDEYEDSIHGPASKHFEKFHLEVDQLPRLVEEGDEQAINDQLTKLKELSEQYLEAAAE